MIPEAPFPILPGLDIPDLFPGGLLAGSSSAASFFLCTQGFITHCTCFYASHTLMAVILTE